MSMPFGKYKGKELGDIPVDYLEWVLANCNRISPRLKRAIQAAIAGESSTSPPAPALLPDLTNRWYRTLALEFHPDRYGSHEGMKAINRARDLLLEMAGGQQ